MNIGYWLAEQSVTKTYEDCDKQKGKMKRLIFSFAGALLLTLAVGTRPIWKVWYEGSWEMTESRGTLFLHISQVLDQARSMGLIEAVHRNYERNLPIWATTLALGAFFGCLLSSGINTKSSDTKSTDQAPKVD